MMETQPFPGLLHGVRVLDLTRILAGPYGTMLLGDLGADVVKVEPPHGDDTRRWGPPWAGSESAYFLSVNRNKRSIALDLRTPEGRDILLRLVERSDILVENFKAGTMERWGLGYEEVLRPRNPRLVYASITGYGRTGPWGHLPGYDVTVEAMAGLMSITGEPEGEPMKVGVAIVDVLTGSLMAYAVTAALLHSRATGRGRRVDLSLLATCLSALVNQGSNYLVSGKVPGRYGNGHPSIVPYQVFYAADGPMMVAVGNDGQFQRFCEMLGHPEWAADPRFATNPQRVAHREVLVRMIAEVLKTRTAAEWVEEANARTIPIAPVNDLAQVFAHPQVQHLGSVHEIPHPEAGTLRLVRSPIRVEGEGGAPGQEGEPAPFLYRRPPLLGEHSREILAEAGYTPDEIDGFIRSGAVLAREEGAAAPGSS